jgi:hypothetical protein
MGKMTKALGTGLGLALAATAGAYLLYKKNPKVRSKTQLWAEKMKKEIKETLSGLKEVNQANYKKTVDQVSERYGRMKEVNKTELAGLVADLKDAWAHFSKDLSSLKKAE